MILSFTFSGAAIFGLFLGALFLAVGIYSIIKLRKQVRKTQEKEQKKRGR